MYDYFKQKNCSKWTRKEIINNINKRSINAFYDWIVNCHFHNKIYDLSWV